MADMTGTTLASYLAEVWSPKVSVTYRAKTVLVPLMDHRWEPELGVGMGDTVNVAGFTQNTGAANRGAGTGTFGTGATLTFTANTEAQTQIKVDRFYYMADRRPLEMDGQVMPALNPLLAAGRGQAIALQVDADLAADNTNGLDAFSTVVGTDNVDVTEDDLITIQTNLNNQNAPDSDRYLVVSPATFASIIKIEAIRNQLYAPAIGSLSGNAGQGFVGGPVYSLMVFMSNNLESGSNGKKNAGFHTEAIAFIEQMSTQTLQDVNIEDGGFRQFLTFQTCGFKEIKDAFGNELDGK